MRHRRRTPFRSLGRRRRVPTTHASRQAPQVARASTPTRNETADVILAPWVERFARGRQLHQDALYVALRWAPVDLAPGYWLSRAHQQVYLWDPTEGGSPDLEPKPFFDMMRAFFRYLAEQEVISASHRNALLSAAEHARECVLDAR